MALWLGAVHDVGAAPSSDIFDLVATPSRNSDREVVDGE